MDEEDKLPLKRVEVSLSKFNEVAIPHHLDLLRQHKANIIKYGETEQWSRVRSEQTHARRVAAQLRGLLRELEALRRRVRAADLPAFDRATRRARESTHRAVMDYLETAPMSIERREEQAVAGSGASTDSVGVLSHSHDVLSHSPARGAGDERTSAQALAGVVQLQVDEQELSLREREATLRGWRELQGEVRALHDAWQSVQAAALAQREHVSAVSGHAEVAADNVKVARAQLAVAERIKAGALGVGGALAGALVGGPVGLVLGAKAAAAALLAGGALGYLTGSALGRRRAAQIDASDHGEHNSDHGRDTSDHGRDTSDHGRDTSDHGRDTSDHVNKKDL